MLSAPPKALLRPFNGTTNPEEASGEAMLLGELEDQERLAAAEAER